MSTQIKSELWTEVLFPAINQLGGWVIFIGTFKGKNHFYDLFSKFGLAVIPAYRGFKLPKLPPVDELVGTDKNCDILAQL